MKTTFLIIITTLILSCSETKENSLSEKNLEMAQSFLDNIIANPEKAHSLLHKDFTLPAARTILLMQQKIPASDLSEPPWPVRRQWRPCALSPRHTVFCI